MGRYIKADDFMDHLYDEVEMGVSDPYEAAENALAMLDEEDVELVRHGHWIPVIDADCDVICWDCSACGDSFCFMADGPKENNYVYCPHCGALMDEPGYAGRCRG